MARFRVRDVVDYHAVIGRPVTHPQMVVRVVMEEVSSLPLYWLEGKVGCVAEDALTVPDRDDTDLLRWAVEHAGMSSPSRAPRWSHVANLLGLGSTYAAAVCCRFNLDPDEVQGGCDYCREGQATVCRCNEGVYGLGDE